MFLKVILNVLLMLCAHIFITLSRQYTCIHRTNLATSVQCSFTFKQHLNKNLTGISDQQPTANQLAENEGRAGELTLQMENDVVFAPHEYFTLVRPRLVPEVGAGCMQKITRGTQQMASECRMSESIMQLRALLTRAFFNPLLVSPNPWRP